MPNDETQKIIDLVLLYASEGERMNLFRSGWTGARLRDLSIGLSAKVGFVVVVGLNDACLYGYALPIPFSTSAKSANEVVIGTCGDGVIAVRPCP